MIASVIDVTTYWLDRQDGYKSDSRRSNARRNPTSRAQNRRKQETGKNSTERDTGLLNGEHQRDMVFRRKTFEKIASGRRRWTVTEADQEGRQGYRPPAATDRRKEGYCGNSRPDLQGADWTKLWQKIARRRQIPHRSERIQSGEVSDIIMINTCRIGERRSNDRKNPQQEGACCLHDDSAGKRPKPAT